jgi:nucleoside-diphosphate-sugar epimerase
LPATLEGLDIMPTAFITGGTGFLGLHVIEHLMAARWRVTALYRKTSKLDLLRGFPVDLAEGSLLDLASLGRAIPDKCDAVFHVAGNGSLWSGGDAKQTRDNVDGTRNVVEAALAKKVGRLVHTSSVLAYGYQRVLPFDESARSTALESRLNYVRTKYLAELEVDKGIARGLDAVVLNPGGIIGRYGTQHAAGLIRLVHARKLPGIPPGGGSFADAREVARAHLAAFEGGRVGERYLLGGTDASYVELVRIIGQLAGRRVPREPMPLWALSTFARVSEFGSRITKRAPTLTPEIVEVTCRPQYFRSDKAIRELGYRAVPLEEMLRESQAWLKSEGLLRG